MAIWLYDKATQKRLFEITPAQRDQLVTALEEEDEGDHDYYLDAAVCEFLEGQIDDSLLGQLRALVGVAITDDGEAIEEADENEPPPPLEDEEGIEIEWREE